MNYDTWKLQAPPDSSEIKECAFCGDEFEPCTQKERHCSAACRIAELND